MPRHRESAIHKYFKYDEDMNESICQVRNREKGKICYTIIKGRKASNLKTHVRTAHPLVYVNIDEIDSLTYRHKMRYKGRLIPMTYSRYSTIHPVYRDSEKINKQYAKSIDTHDDDDDDDCIVNNYEDTNDDDMTNIEICYDDCDQIPLSSGTDKNEAVQKVVDNVQIYYDDDCNTTSCTTTNKIPINRKSSNVDLQSIKKKVKTVNYSSYGDHIVQKLENLPPDMATLCEKIINDVIFEAEMGTLKKNSCFGINSVCVNRHN